ncbi:hypothetical protein ACH42_17610 [Endozoicomonas sp. (ex Bugula neritina AB1)]|nr:hypothetical protein ACH42_17610 [Endozoicomonas sp. (ex Bugula neritina AB1)]
MSDHVSEGWQSVLDFWFQGELLSDEQIHRWWKKDEKVDAWIKQQYSGLIDDIYDHLHQSWGQTAQGRLAAIICLDQFTRNAYRGDGKSFQYDDRAKQLADEGLSQGHDKQLSLIERSFFIMPLMHDEDLASQKRCIAFFEALVADSEGALEKYFSGSLAFARKHSEIIERFGRYPHRNNFLGRESTQDELIFLEQPGSSF